MRWLAWIALVPLAALGGCTSPNYGDGHLQCGPANACPSDFYCASDQHCWRNGSGPPTSGADLAASGNDDLASTLVDLANADLATGPSKCSVAAGYILCEGFENGLLLYNWGQSGSNGMPSIDHTRAFRGSASLRAHISGGPTMSGPNAVIHESATFPIAPTLYARVWAYFPSGLPVNFEQFLNFADNNSTGFSVATDASLIAFNDYAAGGVYQKSTTAVPLDRWTCIQFDMAQGVANGAIHISVDGKLLADLPQTGTTPTAVNVSLGLDFFGNSAPIPQYDAWFDELIIDNKPTTCAE